MNILKRPLCYFAGHQYTPWRLSTVIRAGFALDVSSRCCERCGRHQRIRFVPACGSVAFN